MTQQKHSHLPAVVFACFIALAWAVTCLYPGDWNMPLPLAALGGPFWGIAMELDGSVPILLALLTLMAPIVQWQNVWTVILLLVGLGLWLYSGYMCSLWLEA